MSNIKFIIPALILGAGLAFNSAQVYGKAEYTKTEKKSCVTCHVKNGAKELNATGKCYGEKKKLEGCPAPEKK